MPYQLEAVLVLTEATNLEPPDSIVNQQKWSVQHFEQLPALPFEQPQLRALSDASRAQLRLRS